jgi:hypothetical protein
MSLRVVQLVQSVWTLDHFSPGTIPTGSRRIRKLEYIWNCWWGIDTFDPSLHRAGVESGSGEAEWSEASTCSVASWERTSKWNNNKSAQSQTPAITNGEHDARRDWPRGRSRSSVGVKENDDESWRSFEHLSSESMRELFGTEPHRSFIHH